MKEKSSNRGRCRIYCTELPQHAYNNKDNERAKACYRTSVTEAGGKENKGKGKTQDFLTYTSMHLDHSSQDTARREIE